MVVTDYTIIIFIVTDSFYALSRSVGPYAPCAINIAATTQYYSLRIIYIIVYMAALEGHSSHSLPRLLYLSLSLCASGASFKFRRSRRFADVASIR